MNKFKAELKKIIIEELKNTPPFPHEFNLSVIADNIISKIPAIKDEPVITSPITEDDIVEVLEKYLKLHNTAFVAIDICETPKNVLDRITKQVAKEILGKGEGWKVVAKGKVTQAHEHYEDGALINGISITELLGDYNEENIEIAIKKVK